MVGMPNNLHTRVSASFSSGSRRATASSWACKDWQFENTRPTCAQPIGVVSSPHSPQRFPYLGIERRTSMHRGLDHFARCLLMGLAMAALSNFAPSATVSANADPLSPCVSTMAGSGEGVASQAPCTIGNVILEGVTNIGGGAFSGGGCGSGGSGGPANTITDSPPSITIGGGGEPCTITGPYTNNSGETVAEFMAESGYAIDGVTAFGVCGVTSGSSASQVVSADLQSVTASCPTEAAGMTGMVSGTIMFAPITGDVFFGLTDSTNILGGGSETLESLTYQLSVVATPEPGTFSLLGLGLLVLLGALQLMHALKKQTATT